MTRSDERHVVLVGMMGTGKTTSGQRLANRLGRPFVDSDAFVEDRSGRTVREIWTADGEDAYRVLESRALHEALAHDEPQVIAAAGGVVLRDENRAALRASGALVVWLVSPIETLVERTARQGHRPLLDDDPVGVLTAMERDRQELYRSVASAVIDTSSATADEVVDRIMEALGSAA